MARRITPAERLHDTLVDGEAPAQEDINDLDTAEAQEKILNPKPIKIELNDGEVIECKSRIGPSDVNKRNAEAKIRQVGALLLLEAGKLSGDAHADETWHTRNFSYIRIALATCPNLRDAIGGAIHALSGKEVDVDDIKDLLSATIAIVSVLSTDVPGATKQAKKGDKN